MKSGRTWQNLYYPLTWPIAHFWNDRDCFEWGLKTYPFSWNIFVYYIILCYNCIYWNFFLRCIYGQLFFVTVYVYFCDFYLSIRVYLFIYSLVSTFTFVIFTLQIFVLIQFPDFRRILHKGTNPSLLLFHFIGSMALGGFIYFLFLIVVWKALFAIVKNFL